MPEKQENKSKTNSPAIKAKSEIEPIVLLVKEEENIDFRTLASKIKW